MYEAVSYEDILERMLERVNTPVDKREGSIIWDALAPAAAELKIMYNELDVLLLETFADTASRPYLIKRAVERGLAPDEATTAILRGEFNIAVPIGSRYSLDLLNYVVVSKLDDGGYRVQCETPGTEGNRHLGTLIPIDYISGLTSAELTKVLIPGEDEQDTEDFRKEYLDSLQSEAFGGNKKDYYDKISAMPGVGGVKTFPTFSGGYRPADLMMPASFNSWFQSAPLPQEIHDWLSVVTAMISAGVVTVGAGTTQVVFIDAQYNPPSSELIADIQNRVDPVEHRGEGYGTAPIGHVVSIRGADEAVVDVSTHLTYKAGYDWARVKEAVEAALDDYLAALREEWEDTDQLVIRISQIETRFLTVEGILDIADTTINGATQNMILNSTQVPVRGDVSDT